MCKGAGGVRAQYVDFADWGLVEGRGVQKGHEHLANICDPNVDAIKTLKNAVQQGCNILISGATSTSKTTLFNRILEEVDPRTRIITVANTREIKLKSSHELSIRKECVVTWNYQWLALHKQTQERIKQ